MAKKINHSTYLKKTVDNIRNPSVRSIFRAMLRQVDELEKAGLVDGITDGSWERLAEYIVRMEDELAEHIAVGRDLRNDYEGFR